MMYSVLCASRVFFSTENQNNEKEETKKCFVEKTLAQQQ